MPHIKVSMYKGRTDEQKQELSKKLEEALVSVLNANPDSISIAIEDIEPSEWVDKIVKPEIKEKEAILTKKPGYKY